MLQKVELESTFRNTSPQLATSYFVARQVGHAGGNTRNRVSTCTATMLQDKLKKNVARITGPLSIYPNTEVMEKLAGDELVRVVVLFRLEQFP